MFAALKNFFANFFANLRGRDETIGTKLNVISIVLLVGFDIFFIGQVISGLEYQGARAVQPEAVVPWECRQRVADLVVPAATNEQLPRTLREIYDNSFRDEYGNTTLMRDVGEPLLPLCAAFYHAEDVFRAAPEVAITIKKISDLAQNVNESQAKVENFRMEYSQFLGEQAAGVTDPKYTISNLPVEIRASFEKAKADLTAHEAALLTAQKEFVAMLAAQQLITLAKSSKSEIEKTVADLDYWYPVYTTAFEAVLLLPLLLICLFFYRLSQRREWLIFRAITANAAAITGFFTFGIFLKTVYWLLPKRLFTQIYDFLEAIGFLAVWHYVVIAFGVALFGGLILASQRGAEKWRVLKEERRQRELAANLARVQKERALRGACQNCETAAAPGQHFCRVCGTQLLLPCKKCKHEFSPVLNFCDDCGTAR